MSPIDKVGIVVVLITTLTAIVIPCLCYWDSQNYVQQEESNAIGETASYLENRYDVEIYTVEDFGYQMHGDILTSWGTAVTDMGTYRFTYSNTGETSWIEVI